MDDIEVSFPGGLRVDARVGAFVVHTDQSADHGGGGSALAPFDLFLASLATCAGSYVLAFCHARGLSTAGLSLRQHVDVHPNTKLPTTIRLELVLPESFPEKYRVAIGRAVEGCKVKKTIAAAPNILVDVRSPSVEAAAAH